MIFSSNPSKCVWCFLTSCGSKLPLRSRGTSIGISPDSVLSVFSLVPLRELPDPRPDTACFSYPRCSAISADSAFSTNAAVSFFSNPSGPSKSSGFLYPSKSSFNTSSRIAKVPPFRQDPSSLILTYTKLRTPSKASERRTAQAHPRRCDRSCCASSEPGKNGVLLWDWQPSPPPRPWHPSPLPDPARSCPLTPDRPERHARA